METKEKFERAKRLYETANADQKYVLERLFPELAESEVERIRQLLISFVKYDMPDNYSDDFSKEDCLAWLEKRGEQNPIDKVEPKFNAGDWVILIAGELSTTLQIVKVDTDKKLYWFNDSSYLSIVDEECLHLWTIQDAKDGDVLADNVGVILFRKIGNEEDANVVDYHCAVFKSGGFVIQKGVSYWGYSKDEQLRPATKEQRERLFATMRVAGYEWDADKKELKKIEQKPQSTWKPSEEQMNALNEVIRNPYLSTAEYSGLIGLMEQLKKLRKE